MYISPSITIIINLFFHLLWRPLDIDQINIFTNWEIFAGWATIDGKKKSYTLYEKNTNWKKYIGISLLLGNFEPPFNPTLVRSYRSRRLQLRPTLKRCVSDVFFLYNQRLHIPSCVFPEPLAVVSAYAILADSESGVDIDGADWDELPIIISSAKLLIKLLTPDGRRNQHTFKSHKVGRDLVRRGI